jgi:transposase InsO family protein
VPPVFRQTVIRSLHEVHHPGVRATTRLVKASFCWPKMGKDIAAAARACMGCQLGKVHRHVKLQPEHIPVPHRRFSHLHIDLVGPLPKSGGYTHLFTIIDRTTRWPEAVPVSATSAADCAAALFSGWVQRFGLPAAITSDRGPQFTSAVWAALCRLLSIHHIPTTAYHPQANGEREPISRQQKQYMEPSLSSQANSSPPKRTHRRHSCQTYKGSWLAEHYYPQHIILHPRHKNFQPNCSWQSTC